MNDLKIIYYFKADDGSNFIELKRLNYKECHDKSKYVSWFKVYNKQVQKLQFLEMKENQRIFTEGKMILSKDNNIFINNDNTVNKLQYCYINIDYINLCYTNWDNSKQ